MQPFTFTECVGSYLSAGGDTDVGGKNYAWSLKWTGHAPQGEGRGNRHAIHTAKSSIEIVRRFRTHNPNFAGIMPFTAPFYYCGDKVSSFADVATHNPSRGLYGPSPVILQENTSFAPVLLSLELWAPHKYTNDVLEFNAHVVNDADDGKDVPASTLHWALMSTTFSQSFAPRSPTHELDGALLQGSVSVDAVAYYSTTSKQVKLALTGMTPGEYTLQAELRVADGSVIATNEEAVEVFAGRSGTEMDQGVVVLLYEPTGTQTARALRGAGATVKTVTAAALKVALQAGGGATLQTIVIGEDSWDSELEALIPSLHSFVDGTRGRVIVMQQSKAPANISLAWAPGGASLQPYPTDQYIMHSGLTVGRGRSVHPTRTEHPVFTRPHAITREQLLTWNDAGGWSEATVDAGQATPDQSPASHGFFLNSTNVTAETAANEATLNRLDVLIGHAMGQQNILLAELAGRKGGGAFFVGLGLAARAGSDPVADRMLENVLAFYAAAETKTALHPLVESGHDVMWGNYSSERGLVRSDTNGLILASCRFSTSCKLNGLGNVACGRNVLGPYTWSYMGHNLDLQLGSTVGRGIVWLRTNATKVTTVFGAAHPTHGHHPHTGEAPSMRVDTIDATTLEVSGTAHCAAATGSAERGWTVVCSLAAGGGADDGELTVTPTSTLALRFRADKALVLQSSAFL